VCSCGLYVTQGAKVAVAAGFLAGRLSGWALGQTSAPGLSRLVVERSETGAQLGGNGIPAQGELEALGHRTSACGEHRSGARPRITDSAGTRLLAVVRSVSKP
jgi:hypothetical protein